MENCHELILCAWLEESVLYVRKWDINSVPLCRDIRDTVVVNLQISNGFSSFKIWLDDNILKGFLSTLHVL